jgi:outer membrane protein OmpA-like peptidoglycan-associated protein
VGSGSSFAQQPSEAQILEALKPRNTRGLAPLTPEEQRKADEDRRFIDELRSRQKARSLTPKDRDTVAKIAADKPSVDIEIQFEYDSDVVSAQGRQSLQTLGRVLAAEQLKGTVFFINGHTDAKGGADYNQGLSERRAEAVKRALIAEYRLPADTLIAVGYGKTRLKNTADPLAGENRRVQIVNTEQPAAASAR